MSQFKTTEKQYSDCVTVSGQLLDEHGEVIYTWAFSHGQLDFVALTGGACALHTVEAIAYV